jgi:hypothetical protein
MSKLEHNDSDVVPEVMTNPVALRMLESSTYSDTVIAQKGKPLK